MRRARLIDADTVHIPGTGSVRLAGLDAPELGQPAIDARGRRFDAGAAATEALSDYLAERRRAGWHVVVQGEGHDRYGRILGTVTLEHPDGRVEDAGAWLVRSGLAVAEYGNQYRDEERQARAEGIGLWEGSFERPCEYRRRRRASRKGARRARYGPGIKLLMAIIRLLWRLMRPGRGPFRY